MEGKTLRLTGTAEDQYEEWRKLLHTLYVEETGGVAVPAATSTSTPAATPETATPTKD